ncbi:KRAB-A domain-containing protein 2-like [Littorina saxatilis]|uniref:KRAB-A domain-containing protein 2-like n=1 Tax=Littorina saxatilis TaxID=31220 RepID=UPI0038B4DBCB
MDVEDRFRKCLFERYAKNKNYLLPKDCYFTMINDLKTAQVSSTTKTSRQYKLMKRYEVLQCGPNDKLIRKRSSPDEAPIFFVTLEDTYDTIKTAHIATGHGGRDRMLKELEKKFANIQRDSVELFKSYCLVCQEKQKRQKTKGVVVRPILTEEFNSRSQVDLVDYQSMEDGGYKWIMVYQDHLTKFVVLRPLTSKRACQVALQLVDIFTLFGAPVILQSDNGSEFTAVVIRELRDLWPELKLVHGKPRHPQSQGSVERANGDIKDMLTAWMSDHQTTRWSLGLKFVQFMKNRAYHSGLKRSPYRAMFGVEPRVGLSSTWLPEALIDEMQTEEDLRERVGWSSNADNASNPESAGSDLDINITSVSVQVHEESTSAGATLQELSNGDAAVIDRAFEIVQDELTMTNVTAILQEELSNGGEGVVETVQSEPSMTDATATAILHELSNGGEGVVETVQGEPSMTDATATAILQELSNGGEGVLHTENNELRLLNKRQLSINRQREASRECQKGQAERMIKRSRIELCPGQPGDNVAVPVPLVDRGRGDPRNILGIILHKTENDLYKIATRSGVLKGSFTRNEFELCAQKLLTEQDVKCDKQVSVREAVVQNSLSGGQGFTKCNCSGGKKCQTNRCKCFKRKVLCNSRCHQSLTCKNK